MNYYQQLQQLETEIGLDSAYLKLREQLKASSKDLLDLRYCWRVLRDPFYRSVLNRFGSKHLFDAGFFDDEDDIQTEAGIMPGVLLQPLGLQLLTTPWEKFKEHSTGGVVLLSTGGFAPLHNGHLQMMEAARQAVVASGKNVIGGYVSPGHDKYVQSKKHSVPDIGERVALCQAVCAESDWLYTDPWEGRYTDRAVNFTDVLVRLRAYLQEHLANNIEVCYVFGSDNAGFVRAFIEQGYCVCVSRGADQIDQQLRADLQPASDRVLFTEYQNDALWANSTDIRLGKHTHLPESLKVDSVSTGEVYALRDDLDWATKHWQLPGGLLNEFRAKTLEHINQLFGQLRPQLIEPVEQEKILDKLEEEHQLLNLDPVTTPGLHLEVCRQFAIADGQVRSQHLRNRPGAPVLSQQLKAIPAGEYVLTDDDISSGYTMSALQKMLPAQVRVEQMLSLLHQTLGDKISVYDVCDLKDWLLGAKGGGLVTAMPNGQTARVPYMLPYTSLVYRAKFPAAQELNSSIFFWELNQVFHKRSQLRVSDASPSSAALLGYLGFTEQTLLEEVCQWHLNQLRRLL